MEVEAEEATTQEPYLVCEQHVRVEVEQVNVVLIMDKEDAQNFEFSYRKAYRHPDIVTTDYEMCDEV